MTLVIAAQGEDYVVVGADSRTTLKTGQYSQGVDMAQKIIELTKHVVVLLFGAAESATYLALKFQRELTKEKSKLDGVTKVADRFADFCRNEFRDNDIPLGSLPAWGYIVTGLDPEKGRYRLPRSYILRSNLNFAGGEGGQITIDGHPFIASYKFEREHRNVKNYNDLCSLVAQSIYDTRAVDGSIGGRITIAIIDSKRVRRYSGTEVKQMIDSWEDESR
jgi:20S proteasome alpha/beta subunit